MRKDDLARALVARQPQAELLDVFLRDGRGVGLELDDGARDLAQALVGDADDGDVLDGGVAHEVVLDLDGVDVLAAHDDDVLLSVDEPVEAVLVLARHVAGVEPAVDQGLGGGSGVFVVAVHEAGALDAQLADLASLHLGALLVDDLALPAVAGHADGAHVVDVVHAEVDAARAHGLREAVVGVVLLVGEDRKPALDQALGHGLGADVHEAPLVEAVVGQVHAALLDGDEDVLGPGHEQPHDGAALVRDGLQDSLWRDAAQKHTAAAGQKAAHPVHAGARVVERRDAEKYVVGGLAVVGLLHLGGLGEALVVVEDGLGEAGRARAEVDGRVLVRVQGDHRVGGGAQRDELVVGLGPGRAIVAHVEQEPAGGHALGDLLDAADELGPEDEDVDVGLVHAVLDLVRGVAEVERHHGGAGLEGAEVDGQPLDAVVEQDGDLVVLADPAREQQVGKAVGLLVKDGPGHLAAERLLVGGLDEVVVAPGYVAVLVALGIDLHERGFAGPRSRVRAQHVDDCVHGPPLRVRRAYL